MTEELRAFLYPFGFIAQFAFGLRFLVQWLATEKSKQSVTPKLFWQLSLVGNLLLLVHSMVQLHVPMSLLQSQNLVLSWRNLQLTGSKKTAFPLWGVIVLLVGSAASVLAYFAAHEQAIQWLASPSSRFISVAVHLFGLVGMVAFGLRFWVQWWQAEHNKEGTLTESFWWISLVGALILTIYFFITQDWVNFLGPFLSLIPYSRNLYFLRRA